LAGVPWGGRRRMLNAEAHNRTNLMPVDPST
jgi:hypothetical protein